MQKIFITDPIYRARFISLGIEDNKIVDSLNTKYCRPAITTEFALANIGKQSVTSLKVVTIGNIRPREDAILYPFAIECAKKGDLVFIVPRHPESFDGLKRSLIDAVQATSKKDGVALELSKTFTEYQERIQKNGIVFVDTFGVLESLYALSDIVVSAGSFIDGYQGHNLLEASAYKALLITGPYNQSSESLFTELQEKKAIVVADTADQLNEIFARFHQNAASFSDIRQRYYEFWVTYQKLSADIAAHLEEHPV